MVTQKALFIGLIILLVIPFYSQDFLQTVREGDEKKVQAMIDQYPRVVYLKGERDQTSLHIAAENGFAGIARILLKAGAEVDAREINQNTPLHLAAMKGNRELSEVLLLHKAEIDAVNKDKFTPLHTAAVFNQKEMVRFLVEKGAAVDLREYRGATPLIMVIWRIGDIELTKLLIDKGADINVSLPGSWVTPLAMAAQYGHREIVDLLIDKGVIIDVKSSMLFRFSISEGLDRLFAIMMEKGADLQIGLPNGGTILHLAAQGGSGKIIDLLVRKGFEINKPDRYGWPPLHYAVFNKRTAAAASLIGHGADINARNFSGKSALNIAGDVGIDEIAQLLISKGADCSGQVFPVLHGEYLGQPKPGEKPGVFALDIVSSPGIEHGSLTFTPDGKTVFWATEYRKNLKEGSFRIYYSRLDSKGWTKPAWVTFSKSPDITDDAPFVSPDGKKLFFHSFRPVREKGSADKENIWVIEKKGAGWSGPKPVGETVNRMTLRWQSSITRGGILYFGSRDAGGKGGSDIYYSKFIDGKFTNPGNIGEPVNTELSEHSPFVAPDERYLIFCREDAQGRSGRLFISFKGKDGSWGKPIDMGDTINEYGAAAPYISPDGKYIFFNSGRNGNYDIYWVSAEIIDKIKPGNE